MRLTLALLRKKMPNGHIFRGKYRLVKQVTEDALKIKRSEFALEERNMFFLRHPYLTAEQSHGHAKALGKAEQRMERIKELGREFKPHVRIEDRLAHLRVTDAWE